MRNDEGWRRRRSCGDEEKTRAPIRTWEQKPLEGTLQTFYCNAFVSCAFVLTTCTPRVMHELAPSSAYDSFPLVHMSKNTKAWLLTFIKSSSKKELQDESREKQQREEHRKYKSEQEGDQQEEQIRAARITSHE